ncbi:MAG: D-Ala-D-Ala carboxypeptidase family metallohydrolase [Porcipelethomonas sp.]
MSVKTYSYCKEKNRFISEHFQVKEFASTDGTKLYSDAILIDDKLIFMLEKLFSSLNCTSIRVTSGYRTYEHDKTVGGNGYGQHTKGTAADIICVGKNGIISAKIVCCAACGIGFGGVANISTEYRAIHLDVRTGNKYYGDEIRGTGSIWNYNSKWTDFYRYFGISEEDVRKITGRQSRISYYTYSTGRWSSKASENTVCGIKGEPVQALAVSSEACGLRYRAHLKNRGWLPWVTGCSVSDTSKYAGITGRDIDAVQISALSSVYKVTYRTATSGGEFLPWVTEYNNINENGYAGIFNKPIDRIQIKLTRNQEV